MTLSPPRLLPDVIYEEVRARVLSGSLGAGRPVRQDTIAAELGVSKIPVREALTRLESEGLLVANPRRGYEVRAMSRAEAEEIFDLRLQTEPAAAALGCARADDEAQARATALLAELDREVATGGARKAEMNRRFHLALVEPSDRALTRQLIDRLLVLSDRYVQAHLEPKGRGDRAHDEHAGLLEAWLAGRAEEVEMRLSDHIIGTLNDLKAELKA